MHADQEEPWRRCINSSETSTLFWAVSTVQISAISASSVISGKGFLGSSSVVSVGLPHPQNPAGSGRLLSLQHSPHCFHNIRRCESIFFHQLIGSRGFGVGVLDAD